MQPRAGIPHGVHLRVARRVPVREHGVVGAGHDDPVLHHAGAEGAAVPRLAKLSKFAIFLANFWRARSRLSQNQNSQENMRLTAFVKLYKICLLLHRCNLNF